MSIVADKPPPSDLEDSEEPKPESEPEPEPEPEPPEDDDESDGATTIVKVTIIKTKDQKTAAMKIVMNN